MIPGPPEVCIKPSKASVNLGNAKSVRQPSFRFWLPFLGEADGPVQAPRGNFPNQLR